MIILFFIVLIIQTYALIEWPFLYNGQIVLNITAGVPGQDLEIVMEIHKIRPGLFIKEVHEEHGYYDGFHLNKSTTFKPIKEYTDLNEKPIGLLGFEHFVITTKSENIILKQFPVKVAVDTEREFFHQGFLSLTRSDNEYNFLQQLLKKEGEQVAVMAFNGLNTGVFTLSSRPDYCKNWAYVPEFTLEGVNQWNFIVDSYKVGNFTYSKPSTASFSFDLYNFKLRSSLYYETLKQLGADDDDQIKCEQDMKIAFSIGGKDVEMKHKDYVIPLETKDDVGLCKFKAESTHENLNNFVIPIQFLRNYCISFDFKTKQIGFADKMIS